MEKIKRYEFLKNFQHVTPSMMECENGCFLLYEDHISALKEIFPDWPGEYPKLNDDETQAFFYYRFPNGKEEPVLVIRETEVDIGCIEDELGDHDVLMFDDNDHGCSDSMHYVKNSRSENWGPRVPMWRKI